MAVIIQMSDHTKPKVTPKSEGGQYRGHRYILLYRPNEEKSKCWGWQVKFTRTYEFSGSEATQVKAKVEAQRQIDALEGRSERVTG